MRQAIHKMTNLSGALLAGLLILTPDPASAASEQAEWANSAISACLYPADQPSMAAITAACHTAIAAAGREANSDEHSRSQQNIYWYQAHKAAVNAAIAQSQVDGNVLTKKTCTFVLSGYHAFNQITPKPSANSPMALSQTIALALPDCLALNAAVQALPRNN